MDQAPPPAPLAPTPAPNRALLGWLLLVVPAAALLFAYVLPTLDTLTTSMRAETMLGGGESVGGENYSTVLGDTAFGESLALAAGIGLGAAVGGAVIAFLVAWCVHRAGHGVRTAARITAALAAVAFAPAAWALGLLATHFEHLAEDATGPLVPEWSSWVGITGGVVFGTGLLVGLAAFRGAAAGKRARTILAAAGLTAMALTATGLQAFSFSGVTLVEPESPLYHLFRTTFQIGEFGLGAALSILILILLALLGLGAALLFIGARVHFDVSSEPDEPQGFRTGAGIGAIILLALFATGILMRLWPWLSRITEGPAAPYDTATVAADTWGPALVTSVVGFAAALAGAVAIGMLRPLGDHSLWLLLPFAPWLFTGSGPLALSNFAALRDAEEFGTFTASMPRAWIAVPALFLLTALFWGLERRRRAMLAAGATPQAASASLLGAGWPLAALVALAVLVANAQDTYWQAVSGTPDSANAWVAMSAELSGATAYDGSIGTAAAYPLSLLIPFAAAAVAAAVWYLPKIALRTGK
ncbi:hypothetical protein [Glycomyces paridis]|uniref:Uncharacterized protein n=1 Tax=Glycomyces paridis TaxID=2126555 RepID=A0A4S8PFA3_9ACTN|nr:hypothetical protein [Glycomyces paridis]THV27009.1 hypothetical protein E9998_16135 [Glycomyces paridis]